MENNKNENNAIDEFKAIMFMIKAMSKSIIKLANDKAKNPNDNLTDIFKGVGVDTGYCADINKWETGIAQEWKEGIVIVEEYDSQLEADKGHERWVSKLNRNPNLKLKECRTPNDWLKLISKQ